MKPAARKTLVLGALLLGVILWRLARHPSETGLDAAGEKGLPAWFAPIHVVLLIALAGLSLIPAVNRLASVALDRIRSPSARRRLIASFVIGAMATAYLAGTAMWHHRQLFPKSHDENSYIIQTRLLAEGRLWLPQHPCADFFESFHILVKPVYAPIYFPGTALLNVPMAWLSLPVFVLPVIFAGATVGLAYRIVTELIDGVAGALAALLMIASYWFRLNATLVMSQTPALLLGLCLVLAWLRWRRAPSWKWTLLIGALAGWAAITRPVDALAFALPVGCAMIVQLRSDSAQRWLATAALLVAGALPFLSVQLLLDYGTTGNPLLPPYVVYLRQSQPNTTFGFLKDDATTQPQTQLLQKRLYYAAFMADTVKQHRLGNIGAELIERLRITAGVTVPMGLLIVLLPVGFLAAISGGRAGWWVLAGIAIAFFVLYLPNPFYLEHYAIPLIAPVAFVLVLGAQLLATTPTSLYLRRAIHLFTTAAIALLCLVSLPEMNGRVGDKTVDYPERALFYRMIDETIRPPAVLLVRFHPFNNFHDEPVYNTDVAWPDDAPVVRAHDLGVERDRELVNYYAQIQPERMFYLFDRGDLRLYPLGRAADPAAVMRALHATTRPVAPPAPP